MIKKLKGKYRTILVSSSITIVFVTILCACFVLFNTINSRMKESAQSNLLNTTQVIRNTLEGLIENDLDSLNSIAEFRKNGEYISTNYVEAVCDSLGFDWIGVIDENGNGVDSFSDHLTLEDIQRYEDWVPETRGYSDAYIGQSGRMQITLWVPININNEYKGTVFGSIILAKYYTANVFTFYNGDGRTYLHNSSNGNFILKSLGNDGTPLRQTNLYTLLLDSGNSEDDIAAFEKAIKERKAGTARFNFNGEESYLCFLPLNSSSDWCVTTVVAKGVLLRESNEVETLIRIAVVIVCATILIVGVNFVIFWIHRSKVNETRYRDSLFSNISTNLDSAFIIYEKSYKKTAFVSKNINRLFGLDSLLLQNNIEYIFDWCKIPEDDPQRKSFIDGTFDGVEVREIEVDNGIVNEVRTIKLELVSAQLGQSIVVLTDITKDKQIQTTLKDAIVQAEAANQAKNDFLSAMSHDLRTPINGIIGMTTIADANLNDKEKVHECLNKISITTNVLLRLINDILDMAQIEKRKVELVEQPFNISELFTRMVNESYSQLSEITHQIEAKVKNIQHEEVIGDQSCLSRIASNLISNAIKYTPQGGKISITLSEKQQMIKGYGCYEVTVKDTGIGITPEFQSKIFEPFEREDDVKKMGIPGTGLGMSIVKSLVDLMMGSITVESKKGCGSTFRVLINIRLNHKKKSSNDILINIPVLVLSNDTKVVQNVTRILTEVGMKVDGFNNNDESLEIIKNAQSKKDDYKIIIIDWNNNIEQKEMISKMIMLVNNKSEIVILTDYDNEKAKQDISKMNIEVCLTKPVYKYKLLQKMVDVVTALNKKLESIENTNFKISTRNKVLLVDDNPLNREIAIEFLKMIGVNVDYADNGLTAVEMFMKSVPDTYGLIFMDIQMPIMNGYEATKAIRSSSHQDANSIPIVAMTADTLKEDEKLVFEAGMNGHLSKPISVSSIRKILLEFMK